MPMPRLRPCSIASPPAATVLVLCAASPLTVRATSTARPPTVRVQGAGTVFELSPNRSGGWNEAVIYSFKALKNGVFPMSPVIFDRSGNLYGTTDQGGAHGYGVVFELSLEGTSWTETVLHSFAGGADGADPNGVLIMDSAGN